MTTRCCLTCAEFKDGGIWVGCSWGFTPVVAGTTPAHVDMSGPFPMVLWLWARLDSLCRLDLVGTKNHPYRRCTPYDRSSLFDPPPSQDAAPASPPLESASEGASPVSVSEQFQPLPVRYNLNLHQGHSTKRTGGGENGAKRGAGGRAKKRKKNKRAEQLYAARRRRIDTLNAALPPFVCPFCTRSSPHLNDNGKPRKACPDSRCSSRSAGISSAGRRKEQGSSRNGTVTKNVSGIEGVGGPVGSSGVLIQERVPQGAKSQ